MQRGSASLSRIDQILKEKPTIAAPPEPLPLRKLRGEIEFRGVVVDYGSGRALAGIDLQIPSGSTVAGSRSPIT